MGNAPAAPPSGDGSYPIHTKPAGLHIGSVSMLGHKGSLTWTQSADGLEVTLPAEQPCDYAFTLRITPK
ncbi:MAG: hypothetical protein D6743_06370 [Calditrichaeota bacterium]|nr:MAG: hypothetical protein D6743_06370 [Calditrichota bacterium]